MGNVANKEHQDKGATLHRTLCWKKHWRPPRYVGRRADWASTCQISPMARNDGDKAGCATNLIFAVDMRLLAKSWEEARTVHRDLITCCDQ